MPTAKGSTVAQARERLRTPFTITLPKSGIECLVIKLTPFDAIQAGITKIPNEFYGFVANLQKGKMDAGMDKEITNENIRIIEKFMELAMERCVEPLIAFKYDETKKHDQLLFAELEGEDQKFLLNAIVGRPEKQ